MAELQPEHDPLFERGTQRGFTGLQGGTECDDPFARRDATRVAPVVELVVDRKRHRAGDIVAQYRTVRLLLSRTVAVGAAGHGCSWGWRPDYNRPSTSVKLISP